MKNEKCETCIYWQGGCERGMYVAKPCRFWIYYKGVWIYGDAVKSHS